MTGCLASVATIDEMEVVRAEGADIVDLKDPSQGALGAWALPALELAVARWRSWSEARPVLSATAGDRPMEPESVRRAAESIAGTGVPMVKIGVFPGGDPAACIMALTPLARRASLIAVFFADAAPDFALLRPLATAGFHGAMIDTAEKSGLGLRRHMSDATAADFVREAHRLGLIAGLAGSLSISDIESLSNTGADYLGFRGALCRGGRTGGVDRDAVRRVAAAVKTDRRAA